MDRPPKITFPTILLYIPLILVRVIWTALKALTVGTQYRKYRKVPSISANLKLVECIYDLPYQLAGQVIPASISKIMQLSTKEFSSLDLPGYNTTYDNNSQWFVKRENKKSLVVLYLHGGGYVIPTSPSQVAAFYSILTLVETPIRENMSVLFLDYDLVSRGHSYPRQLEQAYQTYSNLVDDGYTNICIMGDSAGGHLSLKLLQHLKKVNATQFPTSAVLISPRISYGEDLTKNHVPGNSLYDNEGRDCITYSFATKPDLQMALFGSVGVENVTIPLDIKDWEGIPTFTKNPKLFIVCGEDELYRDSILKWAYQALAIPLWKEFHYGHSVGKFDRDRDEFRRGSVRMFVEPWGVHDAYVIAESDLAKELQAAAIPAHLVNREKYFTLPRLAEFFNDTVVV